MILKTDEPHWRLLGYYLLILADKINTMFNITQANLPRANPQAEVECPVYSNDS